MKDTGMTLNEIFEQYPSSTHYVSKTQLQDWLPVKATVLKKTGEKSSSGRDIYEDQPVIVFIKSEEDNLFYANACN